MNKHGSRINQCYKLLYCNIIIQALSNALSNIFYIWTVAIVTKQALPTSHVVRVYLRYLQVWHNENKNDPTITRSQTQWSLLNSLTQFGAIIVWNKFFVCCKTKLVPQTDKTTQRKKGCSKLKSFYWEKNSKIGFISAFSNISSSKLACCFVYLIISFVFQIGIHTGKTHFIRVVTEIHWSKFLEKQENEIEISCTKISRNKKIMELIQNHEIHEWSYNSLYNYYNYFIYKIGWSFWKKWKTPYCKEIHVHWTLK